MRFSGPNGRTGDSFSEKLIDLGHTLPNPVGTRIESAISDNFFLSCTDATLAKKSARKTSDNETPTSSVPRTSSRMKGVDASAIRWDDSQVEAETHRLGTEIWRSPKSRTASSLQAAWFVNSGPWPSG